MTEGWCGTSPQIAPELQLDLGMGRPDPAVLSNPSGPVGLWVDD